jgi:Asp/Glu/hydantoin racemase
MNPASARVALIHATPLSMPPVASAFAEIWPEADTFNLLDDSLSRDRTRADVPARVMHERFATLTQYALHAGARGILFTCSAFASEIEAARNGLSVPILKPNEAMLEAAAAHGGRIALLATFEATIGPMRDELLARAVAAGTTLDVVTAHAAGAFAALEAGDAEMHDARIANAVRGLPDVDVVMLAQFSMARARPVVAAQRPGVAVLTAPHAAVRQLRERMTG